MNLQIVLNTFATDVFRKQGDCDYISARSNFKLQLRQQFLWSAQQCIEKYLKAILLFNGMSARYVKAGEKKEYVHDLSLLVNAVKSIDIFSFELDTIQENFIAYLSTQGPNRYIGTTAYNTGDALQDLDSTVWQIRRYCQYMTDQGLGCIDPVPLLREAVVASALNPSHKLNPQKFTLFNGELEKTLKKPGTDPARKALVWANHFYGAKKRALSTYRTFSSTEIPPNERQWDGVDWKEIKKYVRL
jgi:HEPN domain-containing protein